MNLKQRISALEEKSNDDDDLFKDYYPPGYEKMTAIEKCHAMGYYPDEPMPENPIL